jgi:hypothetical protein
LCLQMPEQLCNELSSACRGDDDNELQRCNLSMIRKPPGRLMRLVAMTAGRIPFHCRFANTLWVKPCKLQLRGRLARLFPTLPCCASLRRRSG